ncbi:hypothetical protein EYZ11_009220 [Aspergillus tanneri]|uniref:Uncharacterized protein n=1 Tax=Aspergillus tanneri TaxID=1220188 RepID=A0A4S3JAL2_9EURO|nr:hypothetical protein EYZ11_009220 [Aspergillus tanneri]
MSVNTGAHEDKGLGWGYHTDSLVSL